MPLAPEVRQKLDQLVASDAVVLFMKGSRAFPQCGFSAAVVGILDSHLPKYATVNILADAEVRASMKEYSEWPTFPQLYIRGEFVGGADIVRQMNESGELATKLSGLTAPIAPPSITITARAAAELTAALRDGAAGDVIHLTISPAWEHGLDLGAPEAGSVSVTASGLTVQLDRASAARASGVVIDFADSAAGGGFKIDNPNRPAAVRQVGPKELQQLLTSGVVKELFDVRTPKERDTAKLAAARHLDDAAMAYIESLPRETPLAFHCHHGGRSNAAAEHFLKLGFKTVYNLAGGIDAWSQQLDPSIARY
jgi:monothiol glutaredoxin